MTPGPRSVAVDAPLIAGPPRQPRLLAGAPRPVGAAELDWILRDAMQYW